MAHERAAGQTLVHEAMAARFSVQVVHEQPQSARQAVCAAFAQLDMLEGQLSRFVEGSDVWRINRLRPGETAVVALDTFRCLALALELQQRTDSAFDVTYPLATGFASGGTPGTEQRSECGSDARQWGGSRFRRCP